jgi:deazaflavin-dependent oxidoreductase (nitroreductase family)
MSLGARIRNGWLALIKRTINPINARRARRGGVDFAVVRTVGRKSGSTFETPIIVVPVADGFIIELTYGPQVNWYQNLVAANGGEIIRGDQAWRVLGPIEISTEEGLRAYSAARRFVLRLLRRTHFRKLPLA